jgi:hypothetical protein
MPATAFRSQRDTLLTAYRLIKQLPDNTVWALTVTEADMPESPSVLNIFVDNEIERIRMRLRLDLGPVVDEGETYETYQRTGALVVSVIENPQPEE